MKRSIVLSLALLLCLTVAACGRANKNEATVKTTTNESTTEGTTVPTTDPVKKDWNVTPIDDALSLPFDDGNGGSPENSCKKTAKKILFLMNSYNIRGVK